MSILLESLNKEPTDQENQVPDVHASHFDDDMLGDEWLLRRIRMWQVLSFLLIVVLVISWVSFYGQLDQAQSKSAELIAENSALKSQLKNESQVDTTASSNTQLENKASDISLGTNTKVQPEAQSEAAAPVIESTPVDTHSQASNSVATDEPKNNKLQYVPKKRQPRDAETAVSKSSISSRKTPSQMVSNDTSQGTILSKEELSSELLSQFPNIEINSFVVAENADDSFVILDGSFYKVNQVIAPNLVLREISKQYILVEFHTQLIKLPHN